MISGRTWREELLVKFIGRLMSCKGEPTDYHQIEWDGDKFENEVEGLVEESLRRVEKFIVRVRGTTSLL